MNIATKISSLIPGRRSFAKACLVIASALTISCETKEVIFNGPYFIRFTDGALTQKESYSKTIKIQVHNAGPAPTTDVIVDYVIGGSAIENTDYKINGTRGRVTIKAGEYFGYIEVVLINNANNILNTQDVTFTLLGVEDRNDLRIGQGESQMGNVFTLTIQDDCILGDTYYGIRSSQDVPVEDIVISSQDCNTYTLSNWDVNIFSFPSIRSLQFIDNGDNTLTIAKQTDPDVGAIEGSGVVDPTTRNITFTVKLLDVDDQPEFTFQLIPV